MITVECTNPDEMRLKVTAEMTIGEWREILRLTDDWQKVPYYSPFEDFRGAIRRRIEAIESRENVKFRIAERV